MLGIVGDLFESLLKRSAGVKDSSALIPGHGGVLDRIDSWLFAGPVYYVFVRYLQAEACNDGRRSIAILGSTGSIGQSALAVIDAHPARLRAVALAAGENAAKCAEQIARVRPELVAMASESALGDVRAELAAVAAPLPRCAHGADGLIAVATHPDADVVLFASSGTAALDAVLAAIEAGKTIALANKEILVMAGGIVMDAARRHGAVVLPVDSEHNAIHQCLDGRPHDHVKRLVLTASGGPFRGVRRHRTSRA